jgi:hypothetical protein
MMKISKKYSADTARRVSYTVGLGLMFILPVACLGESEAPDSESNSDGAVEGQVAQALSLPWSQTQSFKAYIPFSGMCLDVAGNNWSNGTQIQQYTCNGTEAQRFYRVACFNTDINACFMIKHAPSGKCVDIAGASKENGARVQLYTCNNTLAQKFSIQWSDAHIGNGQMWTNIGSQKCLDIADWARWPGARVQQWDCSKWQRNQNFQASAEFDEPVNFY